MDARALLEQYLSDPALLQQIAGSPSFDIGPAGGDSRRQRRGLSPADVQRLIDANPDFEQQIREMYLPGPSLPQVRRA